MGCDDASAPRQLYLGGGPLKFDLLQEPYFKNKLLDLMRDYLNSTRSAKLTPELRTRLERIVAAFSPK
jgi:hypothetical protein